MNTENFWIVSLYFPNDIDEENGIWFGPYYNATDARDMERLTKLGYKEAKIELHYFENGHEVIQI